MAAAARLPLATMADARLGRCPLLFLLLAAAAPSPPERKEAERTDSAEGPAFVSEYFSQSSQTLSFYSWYGSAKVFRFHVPEDTVLLRWLLQASREKGPGCGKTQVTFHIRHGAPPVINPLGTQFPVNTSIPPSFSQTLTLDAGLQNSTFVNLTNPAAGDWFLAAHLPAASSKIEVKGFSRSCTYTFQPDLFVLRRVDTVVLEPDVPMPQALSQGASRPLHANMQARRQQLLPWLLPELEAEPGDASAGRQPQPHMACHGQHPQCIWPRKLLPAWPASCPRGAGRGVCAFPGPRGFQCACAERSSHSAPSEPKLGHGQWRESGAEPDAEQGENSCYRDSQGVMGFASCQDSELGSALSLQTSVGLGNATVLACLSPTSPALFLNGSWGCWTAFSQGYLLNLSMSSREAAVIVPYPESDNWYLSLKLLCPKESEDCDQAQGQVAMLAYLTPCFDDCGIYGQCSLMRRHGYLYAGCICKAGWAGWSCTDGTKAQSVGTQILATLLLTLSNLLFLPAIAAALYHYHLVEASVYTFTMFFSTFYHACDQPGIAVMCIMDYDTLQFCDFLGSAVSIWVTILCMARVKKILKYVLCVLGTLVIAMSLQLDRRGLWNMMGPCVFALTIMASIWVYRGISRRRCYPPSWKRWAFFLFPGISLALVAIAVYVFMETTENYYYTHSIWHILVASSVAFLLPPGDKQKEPWAWSRKLLCRYQICKNDREELYAVS
ncbi:post-GPI attachment to proteins factor 6 isoform 2-T2 [Liasis olivaceus]